MVWKRIWTPWTWDAVLASEFETHKDRCANFDLHSDVSSFTKNCLPAENDAAQHELTLGASKSLSPFESGIKSGETSTESKDVVEIPPEELDTL